MRNPVRAFAAAALVAAATLTGATADAAQGKWKIDASHSGVTFKIKHLMITDVRGSFSGIEGTVVLDPKDPTSGAIEATVDVATINTSDAKRDEHLRSPDFFDVAKFPKATFKSKKIKKAGKGYQVVGDLTIHGVTKEVTFTAQVSKPTQAFGKTLVGIHGETTINRKDFGITWNQALDQGGVAVGEEVQLTIDLELHPDDGKAT